MSLLHKLTAQKSTEIAAKDKKFYQFTCIAAAAVALITMVIVLIAARGLAPHYAWSAIALGVGSLAFYGMAYVRYEMPNNRLIARIADAAVYFTVFAAYTPLQLMLIKDDVYENGSIVCGWVTFGLVAFFSLVFFVASVIATQKLRLFGSFIYMLMALSIIFGLFPLMNAINFAPALAVVLMAITALSFAATPVIFWFFDKKGWQMKVFYVLMAVGTVSASLMTALYVLFCI
ncbi:MAG: hypothetical protein IJ012_06905 [Clostridia bacterium]|nr:hypothetical protein [Clostridia bacterium]